MRRSCRGSCENGVAKNTSASRRRLIDRVHPSADREHVRIVVLAAEASRLLTPRQRSPHALDLVGRDLLSVSGAADDDAKTARVRDDRLTGGQAERRVVVLVVIAVGTVVDDLMTVVSEPPNEVLLELVPGVI